MDAEATLPTVRDGPMPNVERDGRIFDLERIQRFGVPPLLVQRR